MGANNLAVITLLATAVLGCTSKQPGEPTPVAVNAAPTPVPAPGEPTPVAVNATPTPALPAPVTPVASPEPAPAELEHSPPPPAAGSCDFTGTWRLEIVTGRDGCGELDDEQIELALAAVGPANAVAGAARVVGKAGPFGAALPGLRVAPYAVPGTTCGLRVQLGAGPGPHVEMLLHPEGDGVRGQSSLWSSHAGAPCRHAASVFGKYVAAQPQPWSALTSAGPWPKPPVARPASAALVAATRKITAKSIFADAPADDPRVPLRGSIVDYVAAVVETPRAVKLHEVACTAVDEPRCVAIVGDPCRPGGHAGEDCEGMYLTVVVAPDSGKLDRVDAGEVPVETQTDIEQRLDEAP